MVDKKTKRENILEKAFKDENTDDISGKTSPFLYYKEMTYTMNKAKESSLENIRAMCRNGMLTELHYSIMRTLYIYSYLNGYLIREALLLDTKNTFNLSPITGRKAIKTLVGRGLLLQYTFNHIDDNGNEQGSPFIYKLSASGERMVQREQGGLLKYLVPKKQIVDSKPFEIIDVLKRLVINQFHITFMKQYMSKKCLYSADYYKMEYKGVVFPAIYRIELPLGKAILSMLLIPIRSNYGWQNEFLSNLRIMKEFIDNKGITGVGVLVICETEYQSMEAARYKASDSTLKSMEVFYLCDSTIVSSDDALSQLIEVLPKNNFTSRRIFSLNFEREDISNDEKIIINNDSQESIKKDIEIPMPKEEAEQMKSQKKEYKKSIQASADKENKSYDNVQERKSDTWECEIDELIG